MRRSGSSSWRLALDRGQSAHIVLYVRDACGLTPVGPDVPPPLLGEVQVLDLNLSPDDQSKMALDWLDWWRRLIHIEGQISLGHMFGVERNDDLITALGGARNSVFDPFEDFQSLEESPLLRDAAMKTWKQGVQWCQLHQSRQIRHSSTLPLSVADSVILDMRVSPERVRAAVLIFSVIGEWSYISEPGVLLCADQTYEDESLFAAKLRLAFESGIELPLD